MRNSLIRKNPIIEQDFARVGRLADLLLRTPHSGEILLGKVVLQIQKDLAKNSFIRKTRLSSRIPPGWGDWPTYYPKRPTQAKDYSEKGFLQIQNGTSKNSFTRESRLSSRLSPKWGRLGNLLLQLPHSGERLLGKGVLQIKKDIAKNSFIRKNPLIESTFA